MPLSHSVRKNKRRIIIPLGKEERYVTQSHPVRKSRVVPLSHPVRKSGDMPLFHPVRSERGVRKSGDVLHFSASADDDVGEPPEARG
ncbi:hypothetical protein J19TS2_31620 [Cohnella xylanilytica]|nr:hypothetical protein J19TS2_31620 [Cohnella xylanilytica]